MHGTASMIWTLQEMGVLVEVSSSKFQTRHLISPNSACDQSGLREVLYIIDLVHGIMPFFLPKIRRCTVDLAPPNSLSPKARFASMRDYLTMLINRLMIGRSVFLNSGRLQSRLRHPFHMYFLFVQNRSLLSTALMLCFVKI